MNNSRFAVILLSTAILLPANSAFSQLTATLANPLYISDATSLEANVTITYAESGAAVQVTSGLSQTLVDRITPMAGGDYGRLIIGGNVTSGLDFSGKGEVVLASASGEFTFAGPWTPGTSTYTVWGAGITFSGPDTFSDGASARQVVFAGDTGLLPNQITAGNSHTGGTTLTDGSQLILKASGALGTGTVTLIPGYNTTLTALSIEGHNRILGNAVQITSGDSSGSAVFVVKEGALYTGTATVAIAAGQGTGGIQVASGGRFWGVLNGQSRGALHVIDGGVFAGTLNVAANAGFNVYIDMGAVITSAVTITAGNTLTIEMDATPVYAFPANASPELAAGLFADLTLHDNSTVSFGLNFNGMLWVGGDGTDIFLNNANVDFTYFDWEGSFPSSASFEKRVIAYADDATGTLSGALEAINVAEGYTATFEQRADGRELWMVVAPAAVVPEPSAFAAVAGAISLAFTSLRRRRR